MVQAAEVFNLNDATAIHGMDVPALGAIHLQGLMDSPPVVVVEVASEDAAQVPLVHHDHMIQALPTNTPNQPFNVRILPRTPWCGDHLFDPHVLDPALEVLAVDAVAIAQEETWCVIPGECVDDLLGSPLSRRVRGDVEVQDAPPVMSQDQEDKEDLISHGWYDEEVDGRDVSDVILQEAPPCLRRWPPVTHHVLGDRGPGQCDPDLLQLADDVRCTPERIGARHAPDESAGLLWDRRPTRLARARELRPVLPELPPTPRDDGLGLHDHDSISPAGPDAGEPCPEESIGLTKLWSPRSATQHGKLVSQRQILQLQIYSGS